jgi:hypothetical protein
MTKTRILIGQEQGVHQGQRDGWQLLKSSLAPDKDKTMSDIKRPSVYHLIPHSLVRPSVDPLSTCLWLQDKAGQDKREQDKTSQDSVENAFPHLEDSNVIAPKTK